MDRQKTFAHLSQLRLIDAAAVAAGASPELRQYVSKAKFGLSIDGFVMQKLQAAGVSWCMSTGVAGPVAMGGVDLLTPGVGEAWFMKVERWQPTASEALFLVRCARKCVRAVLESGTCHRIQAHVRHKSLRDMRFARAVGFDFEYGPIIGAAHDKGSLELWSMLEDGYGQLAR